MSYTEEQVVRGAFVPVSPLAEEPQLVTRTTVASAKAYVIRLLQLGAVEGTTGDADINPQLQPMIEAIHHVLAGGKAEIKLVEAGEMQVVQELNRRLAEVTEETNTINRRGEYTLFLTT